MGLDTVEIVIGWEETFQISIPDADAMQLETPRMAIDYLCRRLEVDEQDQTCYTLRSFHQLRTTICQITSAPRREVRPSVSVSHFYQYVARRRFWRLLETSLQGSRISRPGWFSKPLTVGDLLDEMMDTEPPTGQRWSRPLVRAAVRASVREYVDRPFRDGEHFIRDLGLD